MRYLKNLPPLQNGLAYNYALLTSSGNIKIGHSTNVYQRVKQLSNSNAGGYKIVAYCISPPNYISKTMEKVLHEQYKDYRIGGEFFTGLDFDEVCKVFTGLFQSESFQRANQNKKEYYKAKEKHIEFRNNPMA